MAPTKKPEPAPQPTNCAAINEDGKECGGKLVLEDYSRNGWTVDGKNRPYFEPPRLEYSCSRAPKCQHVTVLREHRRSA